MKLRTASVNAQKKITHARITDEKGDGAQIRSAPARTLDSVVAERDLKKPFLLKIDVDGAEMKVLAGATQTLASCSVVIIETGFKNMLERANCLHEAGFEIFDIVDLCYYDDRFVQADMIFLSKRIIKNNGLEVYKDGFDIRRWTPYRPG